MNIPGLASSRSALGRRPALDSSRARELVQSLEPGSSTHPGQAALKIASQPQASVLEHVALTGYLRRVAHAGEYSQHYSPEDLSRFSPDSGTLEKVNQALERSWQRLTGRVPDNQREFLGALPAELTTRLEGAPALLHEAILGDSLGVRLEPEAYLQRAVESMGGETPEGPTRQSRLGLALAGAGAAAVVVAAGTGTLAGLAGAAAGFATSWMVNSMVESVFHDKFGHAKDLEGKKAPNLVNTIYKRGPKWLQKPTFNLWFGHSVIHHFRTFRSDHATQFKSKEEQARLDQLLIKEGQQELIEAEYGVTMGWKSFLKYQATALPAYALSLGAATLAGAGLPFAFGFLGPALAFPSMSKIYHRYTHMPAREALDKASFPMKLYLQSDLSRWTVRHHFVHHVDPDTNFNLMPGADWIRGTTRSPSVAELEEMRRLKLLF
ncbi:hypothetical protein JST97_37360 [bacterium]|nr:hypothetical protein [bacterium]